MDPLTEPALDPYPGRRARHAPFDPPPERAAWRKDPGLHRAAHGTRTVWVATRYDDIRTVLEHPAMSAETIGLAEESALADAPPVFIRMDDPEHARIRRTMAREFTARRMEELRPRVADMATAVLDDMITPAGEADLVAGYALPLPSLVIASLLGVPADDHTFFQERSSSFVSFETTQEQKSQAATELFLYLLDLVDRKEREPGDDVISRMVRDYVPTGQLDRETAAMNGMVLLIAGHETTANMIGLSTLLLLEHPDRLADIRDTDDPGALAAGIEELLRYLAIVQGPLITRVATEDVTIGGQRIEAGDLISADLPSGNRDETAFPRPDELDLTRPPKQHVTFGHGPHICLGQTLARVELQVALPVLLRQLPNLRLAVPREQIRFRDEMGTYGVHSLPVAW